MFYKASLLLIMCLIVIYFALNYLTNEIASMIHLFSMLIMGICFMTFILILGKELIWRLYKVVRDSENMGKTHAAHDIVRVSAKLSVLCWHYVWLCWTGFEQFGGVLRFWF